MSSIVAYLSHSYRPEDRAINMEVWKRLNAAGVIFSVDKPDVERPMDVTFLERMMWRAHCFIGIIPRRQPAADATPATLAAHSSWSPYQTLEFRLALRANKPRLVVFERNMDVGPLPPGEPRVWFNRRTLELSPNFDTEVARLVEYARTRDREAGYMPPIGLLRWNPPHKAWNKLVLAARAALMANCEVVDVDVRTGDDDLLARARDVSVLVADLHPSVTPMHVMGLLHGAAIPLYRTCLVKSEQDIEQFSRGLGLQDGDTLEPATAARLALPRLLQGYRVDARMQPVLYWAASTATTTAARIVEVTGGYRQRELTLEEHESGRKYFLGLRGNRVFISTPGDANELTLLVKEALDGAGMPAFHYKGDDDPLRGGRDWQEQIDARVKDADLLLAFLSPSFYARATCVFELVQAVRRWEQHEMLLMVAYNGVHAPEMPPFLERLQAIRAEAEPARIARVVGEVKALFQEGAGAWGEKSVQPLAALVQKHVLALHDHDLATWLHEQCRLDTADAELLARRTAGASDPARELVAGLLALVPGEGRRGAAMARLVMFLRAQESDSASRDQLGRLYSELRLLPDLHDMKAWLERRARGQPLVVTLAPGVDTGLLPWVAHAAGKQEDRLQAMRDLGAQVAKCIEEPGRTALGEKLAARVCVAGTVESLMAPVEWATFAGQPEPLGRCRPVSRRIEGLEPARARLEHAFHSNRIGPPRVLLFGSPSPDLPDVPQELRAIEQCFVSRYDQSGWPRELVQTVAPADATPEHFELLLAGGDHEVLHLACHAGLQGDAAVLLLRDPVSGNPVTLRAGVFGQWLKNSMLRFVYLSCCEGAAHSLNSRNVAGWRQSLCKEVLEAGVPEVVAYVWRVSDTGSVWFTRAFYERFVRDFDAAAALHEARRASSRDDPLWATAVLVQQTQADTP